MKLIRLAALFSISWAVIGQPVTFLNPPPPKVTSGTAANVGNQGNNTFYYWVVVNYPRGNSQPFGPIIAANALPAAQLSANQYITVSWSSASLATSYDLLRTTTTTAPTGACACAVAAAISATTYNDVGAALSAYTVNSAPASYANINLENVALPTVKLRQTVDGVTSDIGGSGGSGTVTAVSVTTANGVSGVVANPTTTPAITVTLGAITPSSVLSAGTVAGSNLSGTNTGDQTSVTGNAGTATALAANPANCSAGSFPLGIAASGAVENCTAAVVQPAVAPLVEDCLVASTIAGVTKWVPCSVRTVPSYNWSQVIGARSGSGSLTLTFTGTSCPAAGTDTAYKFRIYETATPTTYQIATSNGAGTCSRGGAGTIIATGVSTTFTNATVASANDGWSECYFSVASGASVTCRAPVGTYNVYSDILDDGRYTNNICDGAGSLIVPKANNLNVFYSNGDGGPRIENCAINNLDSKTGITGIYTYNASGSSTGAYIKNVTVSSADVCVHLATANAIKAFAYNILSECTTTALWIEQTGAGGDAGVGLIGPNNTFLGNTTTYGVLWNGPGNLKLQGNSFNGFVEQFHGELTMGVVNVSGTAVTWVSGNRFRPEMAGITLNASDTVSTTILTYNSPTSMTLSSSAATCTGCSYYVGTTGQLNISGNTFDGGSNTTHTMRIVGKIPFFNFQIVDNFATAYTVSAYKSLEIDANGMFFGSVKTNNFQTSTVGTTIGADILAGHFIELDGNKSSGHLTGFNIGSSADTITTIGNRCNSASTTNCLLSASSTTIAREVNQVNSTQLSALSVANGSTVFCSNCEQGLNNGCSAGAGAWAYRINGSWWCHNPLITVLLTGNSVGATMVLGTNDNFPLAIKTNNTQWLGLTTTGNLVATGSGQLFGGGVGTSSFDILYSNLSMESLMFKWGNSAEPACNSTTRGQVRMVQGAGGVADTFRVCKKDAADAYAWTALY